MGSFTEDGTTHVLILRSSIPATSVSHLFEQGGCFLAIAKLEGFCDMEKYLLG